MQEVLAIALGSMQNDLARLDQVSMNLANVATPGYKRGMVVQQHNAAAFSAALDAAAVAANGVGVGSSLGVPSLTLGMDPRAGTFKATGQSLDVAIGNSGYFEVATDKGPAYTRQGSFRVDAQGRLVTAQGHAVMGVGGEIFLTSSSASISATGVVSERGTGDSERVIGQLKLMQFPDDARPERLGDGLLAAAQGMTPVAAGETQLRQGFVENSNVNAAHEMTQLIQTMRHFESMHRIAQSHDEMLGTAIRKLGETS